MLIITVSQLHNNIIGEFLEKYRHILLLLNCQVASADISGIVQKHLTYLSCLVVFLMYFIRIGRASSGPAAGLEVDLYVIQCNPSFFSTSFPSGLLHTVRARNFFFIFGGARRSTAIGKLLRCHGP